MAGSTVVIGWGLGLALLVLVGVGAVVATTGRLGVGRDVATASLRAVVQLAAVSAAGIPYRQARRNCLCWWGCWRPRRWRS